MPRKKSKKKNKSFSPLSFSLLFACLAVLGYFGVSLATGSSPLNFLSQDSSINFIVSDPDASSNNDSGGGTYVGDYAGGTSNSKDSNIRVKTCDISCGKNEHCTATFGGGKCVANATTTNTGTGTTTTVGASCASGTGGASITSGTYVPTGHEYGDGERECVLCKNGEYVNSTSTSCGKQYLLDPSSVVLPNNAGKAYTGLDYSLPSNCISGGSLYPTGSQNSAGEWCYGGTWKNKDEYQKDMGNFCTNLDKQFENGLCVEKAAEAPAPAQEESDSGKGEESPAACQAGRYKNSQGTQSSLIIYCDSQNKSHYVYCPAPGELNEDNECTSFVETESTFDSAADTSKASQTNFTTLADCQKQIKYQGDTCQPIDSSATYHGYRLVSYGRDLTAAELAGANSNTTDFRASDSLSTDDIAPTDTAFDDSADEDGEVPALTQTNSNDYAPPEDGTRENSEGKLYNSFACRSNDDCASGYCKGGIFGAGYCSDNKKENGGLCGGNDAVCKSGYCQNSPGFGLDRCANKPTYTSPSDVDHTGSDVLTPSSDKKNNGQACYGDNDACKSGYCQINPGFAFDRCADRPTYTSPSEVDHTGGINSRDGGDDSAELASTAPSPSSTATSAYTPPTDKDSAAGTSYKCTTKNGKSVATNINDGSSETCSASCSIYSGCVDSQKKDNGGLCFGNNNTCKSGYCQINPGFAFDRCADRPTYTSPSEVDHTGGINSRDGGDDSAELASTAPSPSGSCTELTPQYCSSSPIEAGTRGVGPSINNMCYVSSDCQDGQECYLGLNIRKDGSGSCTSIVQDVKTADSGLFANDNRCTYDWQCDSGYCKKNKFIFDSLAADRCASR